MNKQIELKNITGAYGQKIALRDASLSVYENDFLGVIGPNGGGKTTLLLIMLGLMKPVSGKMEFYKAGQPVSSLKMGYLPQMNRIDKRFPISVHEVIASGLMGEKKKIGGYSKEQLQLIDEIAHTMGLDKMIQRAIGELSGGELQRVLLGRAIVSDPSVLILDEPNTYVDKYFESRLYQLLGDLNKRMSIILVSHDIGTIIPLVKNVACVNETLHYHSGNQLTQDWLNEAYHCPIELIGHGDFPHRVLKKHDHS